MGKMHKAEVRCVGKPDMDRALRALEQIYGARFGMEIKLKWKEPKKDEQS